MNVPWVGLRPWAWRPWGVACRGSTCGIRRRGEGRGRCPGRGAAEKGGERGRKGGEKGENVCVRRPFLFLVRIPVSEYQYFNLILLLFPSTISLLPSFLSSLPSFLPSFLPSHLRGPVLASLQIVYTHGDGGARYLCGRGKGFNGVLVRPGVASVHGGLCLPLEESTHVRTLQEGGGREGGGV